MKDNRPTRLANIETVAATRSPVARIETVDRRHHGRHEHRTVAVFDVAGRLGADWEGRIVTAARVTRLTWHKDTTSGLWHATDEISSYACQTSLTARVFADAIRGPWGIENRCTHVRDVTFLEDHSRSRITPGHFAPIRSFALNLVRANGAENVKQELYINALNFNTLLSYRVT